MRKEKLTMNNEKIIMKIQERKRRVYVNQE